MRVTCRVDVHSKAKEVVARGEGFAAEFARAFAEEAAEVARRNVSPGRGPGPHPHISLHIDSGELMRSIKVRSEARGFIQAAAIFSDVEWGLYLEAGFHTRNGRWIVYPWLYPAILEVKHRADAIARSSSRRWFSETGRPYAGRTNIDTPLLATYTPPLR